MASASSAVSTLRVLPPRMAAADTGAPRALKVQTTAASTSLSAHVIIAEAPEADMLGGPFLRQSARDRKIERRYVSLLRPVRDLTANFNVDIVTHLDQYLRELSQTPVTYKEGEPSVNFTLAAFVIDGSASVYGRKVDHLHTLVRKVAGEVAHRTSEGHNAQNADHHSRGARPKTSPKRSNREFQTFDEIELADELNIMPRPQQAPGDLAAAQVNRFLRRPLSMVMLSAEGETELRDLRGDLIGYKEGYRLYSTSKHLEGCEYADEECGHSSDHARGSLPAVGFSLDVEYDCARDSSLATPHLPGTIPPCRYSGGSEELPARADSEVSFPAPVPQAREQEKGQKPFIGVKTCIDSQEEVPSKCRPMLVRSKARKRACDESTSTDGCFVPIAATWVNSTQYPHLFHTELQLRKREMVIPGGERYLRDSMKCLKMKKELREDYCSSQPQEEGFDDSDRGVNDGAGGCFEASDMQPGDLVVMEEDKDVGPVSRMDAGVVRREAQRPTSPVDSSEGDSRQKVRHSIECELDTPMSEFQHLDLQKAVAEWDNRIRPLLDTQEKRESFNIHTYCSRILDHFSDTPSKQTLFFRDICQGQPGWKVARNFVAALELANSYNVELGTNDVLEEGMDTLHLTLLSRKQNFHELEKSDSQVSMTARLSQTSEKSTQISKRPHPADL
ncbi:condensin-2 complex subunit H2-like [Amblyomma americanum]